MAMVGGLAAVLEGLEVLREQLDLVPAAGDALDGALRLGAIHEPHLIRVQAAPKALGPQGLDALATEAVRPDLDDLDARPIGEVVALLTDHVGAYGTTLVLVTHDEELARRCTDRVLRLVDGSMKTE